MFPQLKNKKFLDIASGDVVNVIDQFENIAVLNDRSRVDVKRLLDKSFYDEYIDPKEFFNQQSYQIFAEKIKSIPDDVLQKMETADSESIIMEYDPEEEKRALLEKAKSLSPINAIQNQVDKFKGILDESDITSIETVRSAQVEQPEIQPHIQPQIQQNIPNHVVDTTPSKQEDPMVVMFRNVKKNTEFKISIEIENKIPRPDFIEMMEDSYELSIIDFLADDFTKKILENPEIIKDKIKNEIKSIVYKKTPKELAEQPPTKPTTRRTTTRNSSKKEKNNV